MQRFLAFLLLLGVCQAGLVHNRHAKENANLLQTDQIPVAIVLDKQDLKSSQLELEQQQLNLQTAAPIISLPSSDLKADVAALEEKLPQQASLPSTIAAAEIQTAKPTSQQLNTELPPAAATIDEIKESSLADESLPAVATAEGIMQASEDLNSLKILPAAAIIAADEPQSVADAVDGAAVVAASADDDFQRQATQATPTQTSTPQNFVQQLIQNSPIGQFLSQFAGQQQQQQQQNQQADQPATPQPTLPGFLNPAAAITSAQQAVQNAAQSVVNSTTQAFQGLQQFATNLGTQFQNTFSNLAGQQNQLTTSDSTTTRPPGPIQQIVSNFIGGGNQNGTTAAAQGQQPQGPLQGLLGFFQGGNRPPLQGTTAPPKEVAAGGVDDKIEVQPQNDPIIDKQQEPEEPDSINEVRNSAEVTNNNNNDDGSFEVGPAEELIVVNDDAGAHDEVNAAVVEPAQPAIQQQQQVEEQQSI